MGEGHVMSALVPHVVSVRMVTAVDQKERYGGGGYGGRRSSQDTGGWGWRDGGGRGRDVDYEQRHSEGYGKRGGYPRWGGERREDGEARPSRSVDWNVLLPPSDRLEK